MTNYNRSPKAIILLLFVGLFVIYNANFRSLPSGDTQPAKLLPLSILRSGNLYLDQFSLLYMDKLWNNPYFIWFVKDHWLSAYPVVVPIIISPLYIPLAFFFQHYNIAYDHPVALLLIDMMEKFSASTIAALSVIFLYLILCQLTRWPIALGLSLVYGLASNTWVTSSQALLQHGMSQLLLCLTLWLLARADSCLYSLVSAGLATSLLVANRPPNVIVVAFIALYIVVQYRSRSWKFFIFPPCVATVYLWYNFYYFGTPTGTLGLHSDWSTPLYEGVAGLLVSPSRGLFVYTPWTLFSVWGVIRIWSSRQWSPLLRYLSLGVLGELLLYAKWGDWWGGSCFGPRLLTDLLPLLTIFVLPCMQDLTRRLWLRGVFVTSVLFAFGVQVLGAFFWFPSTQHKSDQWSWRGSQLVSAVAVLQPERPVFTDLGLYVRERLHGPPSSPSPLTEFAQQVKLVQPIPWLRVKQMVRLPVTVTNTGKQTWNSRGDHTGRNVVHLAYRWLDQAGNVVIADGHRTALPYDVSPAQTVVLYAIVEAPAQNGDFVLRLTMLQEGVAWFDDHGGAPLDVPVSVQAR